MADITAPRAFLESLFRAAVDSADPLRVVAPHLPPRPKGRLVIIGAGKASARMAKAVEDHYGPCTGIVITRYGFAQPTRGIKIKEAAHPVPDKAGVKATGQMLDLVSDLGPDDLVIALISGGGSALLCAPADGLSLDDKIWLNDALLKSGAPISDMNRLRTQISQVKGGKLAAACHPARVLALLISDVPGDDPALIASGPTVAGSVSAAQACAIADRWVPDMPSHIRNAVKNGQTLQRDDPRLDTTETRIIAAPSQALFAAAQKAKAAGCDLLELGDALEGEARDLGKEHAQLARRLQPQIAAPLVILSGGECTVTRRGTGIGGPNAEYTLAAAIELDGHPGIQLLSCDTDGVDGAAEIAGAYAGPQTLGRAKNAGLSAADHLARNASHEFFAATDGQIITGPTFTNVNDFRAILVLPNP